MPYPAEYQRATDDFSDFLREVRDVAAALRRHMDRERLSDAPAG